MRMNYIHLTTICLYLITISGVRTNAIQINIYTHNFDYKLYKAYKDNYEATKDKLLSYQDFN